jgi:hypothetical protein
LQLQLGLAMEPTADVEFGWHDEQVTVPGVSAYVLAAHSVQAVAPAADHWPTGQIASVLLLGHE